MRKACTALTLTVLSLFSLGHGAERIALAEYFTNSG